MKPQIILALGPVVAPEGAIVIDLRGWVIWHDDEIVWRRKHWAKPPICFRIAVMLLVAYPAILSQGEIINGLYADQSDGGANRPDLTVGVHLAFIRKRFAPLGWQVVCEPTRGWRLEFLEPQAVAA